MTQPEPRRIPVRTAPSYWINVGPGVSRELPAWLASRGLGARYALVTDDVVAPLHASDLVRRLLEGGLRVETVLVPSGEGHKTRTTKERVEDAMLAAGLGRDCAVVALGGGVVADLAGFVAATYHRGVPYVQVPTTLLAMVDASVGGKTAVDHPRGKNLIGAFHQPAAVFSDVDTLATLPERQLRSGLAELVKAAAVADEGLFEKVAARADAILSRDPALLTDLIARACEIKAEVVAADEREHDLRKILNFGHTIGHALETLSGYAILHGEAVSAGMVAEARLAVRMGHLAASAASALEELLGRLGLPVRLPAEAADPEAVLEAARADKKVRDGRLECALPAAIGRMARGPRGHGIPIEVPLALEVLRELA